MPFISENVASGPQNHPSASTAHSWFRDNGTGGVAEEEAEVALMMVLPLRVLFPRDDDERENNDIADDGKKLFIVVVVVGDIICLFFFVCVQSARRLKKQTFVVLRAGAEVRYVLGDDRRLIEKIYERDARIWEITIIALFNQSSLSF